MFARKNALRRLVELDPRSLAGLAVCLRGAEHCDMIAIAFDAGAIVEVSAWSREALPGHVDRDRFIDHWTGSPIAETSQLAIIAFADTGNAAREAATQVEQLSRKIEATTPDRRRAPRCMVVIDGRWGTPAAVRAALGETSSLGALAYVSQIDPAAGRLLAAAIQTRCAGAEAARALQPATDHKLAAAREAAADMILKRSSADPMRLHQTDITRFTQAREHDGDLPQGEATALAVAAAYDERFRAWVVDQTLSRPGPDLTRIWCTAARYSTGTQRSIACALAALAAWCLGEPLALAAVDEAVLADCGEGTDFPWSVWHLVHSNTRPAIASEAKRPHSIAPSTPNARLIK